MTNGSGLRLVPVSGEILLGQNFGIWCRLVEGQCMVSGKKNTFGQNFGIGCRLVSG